MVKEDISDNELEELLNKDFRGNEKKREKCGKPIPSNKEIGIQRTNIKTKKII
ncbi:MAG: hypothetical protein KGD63_07235 [Candidatus Lokiarchaeota archaeon]|nr:hypothetical protein [Candidatus Lokiarchaeota archaeon]